MPEALIMADPQHKALGLERLIVQWCIQHH